MHLTSSGRTRSSGKRISLSSLDPEAEGLEAAIASAAALLGDQTKSRSHVASSLLTGPLALMLDDACVCAKLCSAAEA